MQYAVTSDATAAINSMIYAQRDLMAGFTTLRDEGAQGYSDVAVRDAINAGKIVGPRISCSGEAIGGTGGHADSHFLPCVTGKHAFGQIIDGPDAGRKAARTAFKYGADQIKIMATGGVMSFGDEPGAPELTYEEMKAIIDVAASKGKITSAHAHGAEGIKIAVRAGITSIEHGMLMDEECMDMMAGAWHLPDPHHHCRPQHRSQRRCLRYPRLGCGEGRALPGKPLREPEEVHGKGRQDRLRY